MTTIIEIGRGIKCINTPKEARKKIEKDLTIDNPAYTKAIKLGLYTSADPYIILYDSDKTTYWMPRGYVFFLIKFLKQINHPYKIVEKVKIFEPLNFKFHGKLRDYQEIAQKNILKYPIGVLEAGTGSGKTVSALSVIVERQQPTLIIVHTKELLYQWKDRIKQFLKEDAGIIGDGKFEIKDISIGTIQTVKKRLDELTPKFGFLIVDEVHRHAHVAGIFTIQDFPAKYYLGLTATPFRSDKLGRLIFTSMGPKIHIVNKKKLFDNKSILRPDVFRINTNFRYIFTNDYTRMISELTNDDERNHLICTKTLADLKDYNDVILLVSDRKKHVKILQEMLLDEYGIKSIVLTGGMNKKKREENLKNIQEGKTKVIIATVSLIGEGFDLDSLTALFLTTPIKFSGRLIQSVGRVLRPSKTDKNKIPRIYDFRDDYVDILKYSGYSRDRIYNKEWK
jgi:superfamily II DNA or RNA helicase